MEESGYRMVRYADDFVILCRTRQEAEAVLDRVAAWVAENGLTLHPDKTRIGDCREPGQGFEFLGYRFEAGLRLVRKKSLRAFKDKVRAMTGRSRGASMRRIIDDLNPVLRGWFGYFKQAAPSVHHRLDGFIRRRLRSMDFIVAIPWDDLYVLIRSTLSHSPVEDPGRFGVRFEKDIMRKIEFEGNQGRAVYLFFGLSDEALSGPRKRINVVKPVGPLPSHPDRKNVEIMLQIVEFFLYPEATVSDY